MAEHVANRVGAKPSQVGRYLSLFGAILLLASWYFTTEKLQQQLDIRAEQRSADTYSFMLSYMGSISAQLKTVSTQLDLVNLRLERPARYPKRLRTTDTSLALMAATADLDMLAGELDTRGSFDLQRAQDLMLQAATLPDADSITNHLGNFFMLGFGLPLKLDSVRDSLATLAERIDARASSALPANTRIVSADSAAAWVGAEVARIRGTLDSASAVLDKYEEVIPLRALDHQALIGRRLIRFRNAALGCYVLGAILVLLGQFLSSDHRAAPEH